MKINEMKYVYFIEDEYGDIGWEFFWVEETLNEIPYEAEKAMRDTVVFPNSKLIRLKVGQVNND